MGVRNYLIEGVSGTGKTSVAEALQRRGHHVVHGDRELAYRGNPETGEPLDRVADKSGTDSPAWVHAHHIWHVDKVKALVADHLTRKLSSAAAREIPDTSSICSTRCSFSRSIPARWAGGLPQDRTTSLAESRAKGI
ncbi:MAG TPA: hypothetical protein VHZ78_12820 [Rhizomicrobium sp.]|jgi:adenylate kinase|nr:hypothetical protein [Rhizomicrobium sp.]